MTRRGRRGQQPLTVRPVDADGVRTVAIGTVLWAVAFVVLAVYRHDLDEQGLGWWLWTCLAGVGLGLLGLEYTRKRRDAIARARLREEADRSDEVDRAEPADAEPSDPEAAELPAESESVAAEAHPRPEPQQVAAESEPVPATPPIAAESEPVPATPPALAEQQAPTTDWAQASLLDVEPPVPVTEQESRRARRAARNVESAPDLDEPLLPTAYDLRIRTDDRPSVGRRARRDDSTDDDEVSEDTLYRGRRARRP
jgi:hypothetical protein